jgi:hypothetical protein
LSRPCTTLGLAVVLALAGCQRDPLDAKISASSQSAYENWRGAINGAGADVRRRADEALPEVRTNVAADLTRGKTGQGTVAPAAIDEAFRKEIDGRPLREVLQLGYELRVARLKKELAGLQEAMKENATLTTRPGDWESKQHLEALQGRQNARVEKYREDIAAAERELEPLKKASGKTLVVTPTDKPDQMPVRK